MVIYMNKGIYDIMLDISNDVPENLRTFIIRTENDNDKKYGTI